MKNVEMCPHCQRRLTRLDQKTALINRTDGKTFHLTLFSGPYRRSETSGDLHEEILICTFVHVLDRLGPNNEPVAVTITLAHRNLLGALRQTDNVAEKLAPLIAKGEKLKRTYRFDKAQLEPVSAFIGSPNPAVRVEEQRK